MPSITYWNRVEPRPRSRFLTRSLSAQVRDALWFLTRQWQFGEFQGEDAGSPAYVQLSSTCSRMQSWQIPGGAPQPIGSPPSVPMETLVEREPFTPDLATAVELGQRFEAYLAETGLAGAAFQSVVDDFRTAYRVPSPTDPASGAAHDPVLARFLRVCAGRAIHGVTLYQAYLATRPALPPAPAVDPTRQAAVGSALERLVEWVRAVYGELGTADPPAWRPERLEYDVRVRAMTPAGSAVTLAAYPGRFGDFDWYAFDQLGPGERDGRSEPETTTRSLLPIHVRFRGMPNTRWWHFERGSMNLADVKADRSELSKLILIDFMLVHGNDWFVVPFTQEVGTLCRVDAVLVHDVFGDTTLIPPANAQTGAPAERWSLFALTVPGTAATADYFVLPPSAPSATLGGEALEEVRFLRDEMFNSAWGLEHTIENGLGQPWSGHERAQQIAPLHEPLVNDTESPLKYVIETDVPLNWIPFLPVAEANGRAITFQRAAMLRPNEAGTIQRVEPVGRILRPQRVDTPGVYKIREEEIPRTGVRVSRLVRRTRWIDGSTHIWIARAKTAGAGEGSSGLRFDLAISQP